MGKIKLVLVPKRAVQPSLFVMTTDGGHDDNVSPRENEEGKICQQ